MKNGTTYLEFMVGLPENAEVQRIAKQVLAELADTITPASTERSIASYASQRLMHLGISDTWYYSCPAFVLLGSRSCLSISGRDYSPNDEPVGLCNLVTVDLSPCRESIWGDCARSFAVEKGRVVDAPTNPELRLGIDTEKLLHSELFNFATPATSFSELYEFANELIISTGFENLDFLGNVGHSISTEIDERLFIEASNKQALGSVPCFTFEPHIRQTNGKWGFKHENIYYFTASDKLTEL